MNKIRVFGVEIPTVPPQSAVTSIIQAAQRDTWKGWHCTEEDISLLDFGARLKYKSHFHHQLDSGLTSLSSGLLCYEGGGSSHGPHKAAVKRKWERYVRCLAQHPCQ